MFCQSIHNYTHTLYACSILLIVFLPNQSSIMFRCLLFSRMTRIYKHRDTMFSMKHAMYYSLLNRERRCREHVRSKRESRCLRGQNSEKLRYQVFVCFLCFCRFSETIHKNEFPCIMVTVYPLNSIAWFFKTNVLCLYNAAIFQSLFVQIHSFVSKVTVINSFVAKNVKNFQVCDHVFTYLHWFIWSVYKKKKKNLNQAV